MNECASASLSWPRPRIHRRCFALNEFSLPAMSAGAPVSPNMIDQAAGQLMYPFVARFVLPRPSYKYLTALPS